MNFDSSVTCPTVTVITPRYCRSVGYGCYGAGVSPITRPHSASDHSGLFLSLYPKVGDMKGFTGWDNITKREINLKADHRNLCGNHTSSNPIFKI